MVRNARLKLTLAYTLGIALIMAAFSIALYLALQSALSGNLEVGGNASHNVEQSVLAAELYRTRLVLLAVNVAGWLVGGALSYLGAGRTLKPIEQSVERQRQFTAHASHALRTPLTVMKGEIDVTLARARSVEEYQRVMRLIGREVDRIEGTVEDLLSLAELNADAVVLSPENLPVSRVIAEAVATLQRAIVHKQVNLVVRAPPELEACLDWERFRLLLQNLVENAVRHTPAGGEVRIEAREHGQTLELEVFNSGSRIDPTDLPYLFVPFYRGRSSRGTSGVGLGLALAEWVARAHGGSIRVENHAGGVAFTARLPTALPPSSHGPAPAFSPQ